MSRRNLINHCRNEEELKAAEFIWNNPNELKFVEPSKLGEVKDMNKASDAANIAKKELRGVISYNLYEFEHNGKKWKVKLEVLKNGSEQFYSIVK